MAPKEPQSPPFKYRKWFRGWFTEFGYSKTGWWDISKNGYRVELPLSYSVAIDPVDGQTLRRITVWRFVFVWARPKKK